jgi:uncharacterized cupin superfamily protein
LNVPGASHNSLSPLSLQTGKVAWTDLKPAPLKSTLIIEGNPSARSLPLGESADGNFSFGLWDCTAGQFQFNHRSDEFVHILEGEATIRAGDKEVCLRPGDVAYFPQGLTTYWTVPDYVKKLATFRSVQSGLVTRIVGKMKEAWRRLPPA